MRKPCLKHWITGKCLTSNPKPTGKRNRCSQIMWFTHPGCFLGIAWMFRTKKTPRILPKPEVLRLRLTSIGATPAASKFEPSGFQRQNASSTLLEKSFWLLWFCQPCQYLSILVNLFGYAFGNPEWPQVLWLGCCNHLRHGKLRKECLREW